VRLFRFRMGNLVGLAMVAAMVSGCAVEPVPVLGEPGEVVSPALTQDQTYAVLNQVAGTLDAATASRDAELLPERVTGPAYDIRASQLEVARIRDDNEQITVIPDTYQQLIVPTTATWPRTVFAITAVTEQLQPPRLLALTQASPREPYQLWGWVQLLPGVTMPAFADPRVGSAEIDPNDASGELLVSPAEAVRQYADLLVNGEASAYTANFQPEADDQFRSHFSSWRTAQETALQGERIEGTYTFTANPAEGSAIKAVQSFDGGAMVMAEIRSFERLAAMEGAILAPQTATAQALLHGQEFTNILTASYIDIIALYIPPAGSGEVITLLGYSHIQTGATVSDPPGEEPAAEGEAEPEPTDG